MKIILKITFLILSIILISCSSSKKTTKGEGEENLVTTPSGLKYVDLVMGTGPNPRLGQKVTIHYIVKHENGFVIENSYESNKPISFTMGQDETIPGLEEGVLTMKQGGKRRLYVPPELGYGSRSNRSIPPNSNLTIDVELIRIN